MQIFNLSNYKDPVYRNIMLFCLLSFTAIGDIFIPLLNYMILDLPKTNSTFINYTTLVNTIPTLPFMFSIILGIIANQFTFCKMIKISFILTLISSISMIMIKESFINLIICSLIMSIIFRIIYLALDKHLTQILIDKISDFQSDIFILGSIIGIICYKLSAYIYIEYHINGLITLFIVFSMVALYFASQIPIVRINSPVRLYLYPLVLKAFIKHAPLIQFSIIIILFNFISSCYNSYVMLILKAQNTNPNMYANINTIAMIIGIGLAFIPKNLFINRRLYLLFIICMYLLTLFIFLIQIIPSHIHTYYVLISALSSLCYIISNIIIFRFVGQNEILKNNAPLFLSIWATILYVDNLCSQLISNLLLHKLIDQLEVFNYGLVTGLFLISIYISIKKPAIK